MCCRYYVESTPYFIELGELALQTTFRSHRKCDDGGSVLHTGEIRPGNTVTAIMRSKNGKKLAFHMFWGMHAQNNGLIINARTETASERPMFKDAWAAQRCIIPASWYYEWEHFTAPGGAVKTGRKFLIQPSGDDRTFMCGLYRLEQGFPHFSILTRPPGEKISFIHDRMPLILPESRIDDWIDPLSDPAKLAQMSLTNMEKALAEEQDQLEMKFLN